VQRKKNRFIVRELTTTESQFKYLLEATISAILGESTNMTENRAKRTAMNDSIQQNQTYTRTYIKS
jgi:hypothetical protein